MINKLEITNKKANESDKDEKNNEIIEKIKEIFITNKERYGYRRIILELRNQGYKTNEKTRFKSFKKE